MTRDIQDTMPAAPARRTRKSPAAAAESAAPAAARAAPRRRASSAAAAAPAQELLRTMVAEAAYYRAERRGFLPGWEMEDWLSAEAEVLTQLCGTPAAKPAAKTRRKTPGGAGAAGQG